MTLGQARAFVTEVNDKVGRFPGLYSGSLIKEQLGNNSDEIFAQCFFWLAQYGPTPLVPANCETWTLALYTGGNLGPQPHTVPGIGACDRDKFNGDIDGLKALWGVL